ncbi:hypothetical protein M758_10G146700 [Ceratodon purpureus]|nr:hypothetical protein M758_10G146700 [Ceratodon purpureus]
MHQESKTLVSHKTYVFQPFNMINAVSLIPNPDLLEVELVKVLKSKVEDIAYFWPPKSQYRQTDSVPSCQVLLPSQVPIWLSNLSEDIADMGLISKQYDCRSCKAANPSDYAIQVR